MYSSSVLLLAAVAVSIASTAFAINCYQCESAFDSKCGEKFEADGVQKTDCSRVPIPRFLQPLIPIKNATGCMKIVNELNGLRHTIRSCYFGDVTDKKTGCQTDPVQHLVTQVSCDVCTENLCNSATTATGPVILTLILFAVSARILK